MGLKLISRLPDLAMIVNALIAGSESIGFIFLIMFIVFYLFAILAVMLFCKNPHEPRDSPDYSCNDPWHFGTLHEAMLTLFRVCTFEDWTDVMYINIYGCNEYGYDDDDSVPYSIECHEKQKEDYPVQKEGTMEWATMNWLAALYFLVFTILSAMVLLTLFIGVICTSMEEAAELGKQKRAQEAEMLAWCKERDVPMMAVRAW